MSVIMPDNSKLINKTIHHFMCVYKVTVVCSFKVVFEINENKLLKDRENSPL